MTRSSERSGETPEGRFAREAQEADMAFERAAEATARVERAQERVRELRRQLSQARNESARSQREAERALRTSRVQSGQAVEARGRTRRDEERERTRQQEQARHIEAAGLPRDTSERLRRSEEIEQRLRQLEIVHGAEMTDTEYWQNLVDTHRAAGDEETAQYIEQQMLGRTERPAEVQRETRPERASRETREARQAREAAEQAARQARAAEARVRALEQQARSAQARTTRLNAQARTAAREASVQLRQVGQAEARVEHARRGRAEHLAAAGLPPDTIERLNRLAAMEARIAALEAEGMGAPEAQESPTVPEAPENPTAAVPAAAAAPAAASRQRGGSAAPRVERVSAEVGGREPVELGRSVNRYIVEKGDSLWKIAEKVYGDGNLYTYLRVEGKGDRIPRVIHPGDVIVYRPIIARGRPDVQIARGEIESPTQERRPEEPPAPETPPGAVAGF